MKIFLRLIKFLLLIFILSLMCFTFNIILNGYRNNYFNGFTKAESYLHTSTFSRDENNKYNNIMGYKIESPDYNDAMFYKNIKVKPNTAYKVTCMVKTENIESKNLPSDSGAHISISTTTEKSSSIRGTNDWQQLTLYFNSKNRTDVNIAFRLGGYSDDCKGTAWFANFKLEQGVEITDNNWNYACFIFKNIDVNLKDRINLSMNDREIGLIKDNIRRFAMFVGEATNGKLNANCNIIEINTPITSVSYDSENGYFVSGDNISEIINNYVDNDDYQHIFAFIKFGIGDSGIPVNDWLGLGSMTYHGIGFSNIRIPGDKTNNVYELSKYNQFPEEVLVHEFLHDLERISKDAEFETPSLHDNKKYGYEIDNKVGLKDWYEDYMNNSISYGGKYIGIVPEVYKMKPVGEKYLEYSMKIDFVNEPKNIIEELSMILSSIISFVSK